MNKKLLIKAINKPKPVSMVGYTEIYAYTWLCSHIRLFRINCDASDYSREHVLAWILKRNESEYIKNWQDELLNITIEEVDQSKLEKFVYSSNKQVENSEYLTNQAKLPVSKEDLKSFKTPQIVNNLKLYDYGPNIVMIWESKDQFWYLEEHVES